MSHALQPWCPHPCVVPSHVESDPACATNSLYERRPCLASESGHKRHRASSLAPWLACSGAGSLPVVRILKQHVERPPWGASEVPCQQPAAPGQLRMWPNSEADSPAPVWPSDETAASAIILTAASRGTLSRNQPVESLPISCLTKTGRQNKWLVLL